VSRRCRHLRADLANGKIDEDRCLICPWHQSRYDPTTGRMVVGPRAGFEKVPGLDTAFIQLTKLEDSPAALARARALPSSAPRCGAPTAAPTRAHRSRSASSSPNAAARPSWSSAPAWS
jgi:hypothetical protein